MAREEHDREDMLAEAKALVERISLEIAGHEEPVIIGFRSDESASFYFDPQRVYQFTSTGQLRRAFVGDLLFKAERGQLVSLRRERSEHEVALIRHVLDPAAAQAFFGEMLCELEALDHTLAKNKFKIIGQIPEDADLIARIHCWLDEFAGRMEIADSPQAR